MHRCWLILLGLVLGLSLAACGAAESAPPPKPEAQPPAPITIIPVTPTPLPVPISTTIVDSYVVRSGDTLGRIAGRNNMTVEELQKLNGLANPNALQAGQVLKISMEVARIGPGDFLLPDSELVYGPSYTSFDVAAVAGQYGGYLNGYREKVDGETLAGPQIIQLVAERFSVGPRVLLALMEFESGWVTGNGLSQAQIAYPMGLQDPSRSGLFYQASWAANHLNEGYYGKLSGRLGAFTFKDRTRARVAPTANPGTVAIQNVLALTSNWDNWQNQIGADGFVVTYRRLFGDPKTFAVEPLLPPDLKQPTLRLPWSDGATWYYTGGPHSGWGDLSAWAAVDLTPGDVPGSSCYASRDWALAAAPGRVIASEHGRVVESLSNDNFQGTGWALLYMHIANAERIARGTQVNTGGRIGHPSCEGGDANASHVHLARLYNGQWIDPETVPFILSGWTVTSLDQQYDGKMTRGAESREAANGRDNSKNAVVGDAR